MVLLLNAYAGLQESNWISHFDASMLFLKVVNANIGFNQLFKYLGPAPPGEWNGMMLASMLINT